ncbi:hypothetical protein MK805_06620 [Shimazuella sp. AN120528]|uniref:hypothetical protein n=1 Tax=Shimazuella soli TaxID=1892854 RepID=UPI001F0DD38E|nr:hypothetical protein [Shimazuella soli]MCH5584642.1 hypothetical protein [Shimazuella soli]
MLFSWWRGKKDVQEDLKKLTEQLKRLESTLEISLKNNQTPPIHIEHLTIDNPKLENLVFRMDSLDVEEISGSLNLGNNFGVKEVSNKSHRAIKTKKSATSPDKKANFHKFTKTASGFRLNMDRKNEW